MGVIYRGEWQSYGIRNLNNLLLSAFGAVNVIGMDVITEAEEIDLVITINSPLFDIFDILGSIFIIECRNLKKKG